MREMRYVACAEPPLSESICLLLHAVARTHACAFSGLGSESTQSRGNMEPERLKLLCACAQALKTKRQSWIECA